MWLFFISYILSNTSFVLRNYGIVPHCFTFINKLYVPVFRFLSFFIFFCGIPPSDLIPYWSSRMYLSRSSTHKHPPQAIPSHTFVHGVIEWLKKSKSKAVVIQWDGSCQRWHSETLDPQKWILGQDLVTVRSKFIPLKCGEREREHRSEEHTELSCQWRRWAGRAGGWRGVGAGRGLNELLEMWNIYVDTEQLHVRRRGCTTQDCNGRGESRRATQTINV